MVNAGCIGVFFTLTSGFVGVLGARGTVTDAVRTVSVVGVVKEEDPVEVVVEEEDAKDAKDDLGKDAKGARMSLPPHKNAFTAKPCRLGLPV